MLKKPAAKIMAITFALMLFLFISVFSKPIVENPLQKADCSQTTDMQIVKTLYDKMRADNDLIEFVSKVNFSVKDKKVLIEGWVARKDRRKAIENLVKNTECVKKVKNSLKEKASTGCPAGQKQCGEICIDKNSDCNIGN